MQLTPKSKRKQSHDFDSSPSTRKILFLLFHMFLFLYVLSLILYSRKEFYVRKRKYKVSSIEIGCIVIARLFPYDKDFLIIDDEVLSLLLHL